MTGFMQGGILRTVFAALALTAFSPNVAVSDVLDDKLFTLVEVEQLEYRSQDGADFLVWDAQGRIGTDYHKVAVKSEGEFNLDSDKFERAEFQVLYQRLISDFFDAQIGIRHDVRPGPSRTYGVVGINGLAPQWFEVDASFFVSDEGDVSARFGAEYDILLTQRLILQPSAEMDIAFSDDRAIGVGSGIDSIELGLRLRYEVEREFAPYLGINWERKLGRSADFAEDEGEDSNVFSFVLGVRMFF